MINTDKNSTKEVSKNLFPVVGIGASAGGLEAFRKLIQSIPAKSGMAYIIVQHLHPEYESALPEILQRETKIPVVEISDKVHVEPDFIYVIPANKMLTASDGILQLSPRTNKKKNELAIDIFFSSLAEVHQAQSIGVILSGTGSDGTAGLEDIKNHGGLTFAQDAETAAYNAMPQNAIDAGIIDFVLPPEKIVEKLVELQKAYSKLSHIEKQSDSDKVNEDGFRKVLAMLRMRTGVDFNFYKQTTIHRRIIRRMMILKLKTIHDYQQYLQNDMAELDLLFQDMLIQVTSFFRDPKAYEVLCTKILPEIIKNKSNDNLLRICVPGYARIDQLNEARKFSDSIISIMHEPLLVLGRNFIIKRANEAFYKTFKLTEEKTIGKVLFELQDNTWAIASLAKGLNRIREEKQQMIELEVEHTFPVIGTCDILFNIRIIEREDSESLILLALNDITERKNAEKMSLMAKNIEQNAEMLNDLYMNSPAFMCTLRGPKHIYDFVNPACQKMFGSHQITGKALIEVLPGMEGENINKAVDKVYQTGEIFVATEAPLWLAYDEGLLPAERYFNFSCQPIYDENKKISDIQVIGYEVTEQVLAKKKNEENLRLILETVPQITFTASSEGKILFFNKYALDYSGLTIEEATTGKGWGKIVHPEEVESLIALAEACMITREDFYKEIRLKRNRDGQYRWHLMRATSIKDGMGDGITAWVGLATDIQDQKIKELKKDEFMNIASHEMKTPLAATKGYLQLLEMTLDSDTEPALFVNKALGAVNRLNNLINELLEVGKTQNGKLDYKITVFDFNKMVDDTIEDQRNVSPDYTIIKKGRITSEIKGDRDRLQQVIINLVSNAIKYSPDEKKIIVTVKEKNGNLIFSVKDHGIGISKENIENVFKRYFRVEDQAMRFQGMGIGLFISHEIIKRHHGKVWLESEIGKGSTFYFSVPVNR